MSKLVGACTLMSLDELRVRSPLSSNRKHLLTSNRSAVVHRALLAGCSRLLVLHSKAVVPTMQSASAQVCSTTTAASADA